MEWDKPDERRLTAKAEILKALAHPVRLCIVKGLIDKGECNVGNMQGCLGLPQSTISQHLAKLRVSGIVTAHREGLEVFYAVTDPAIRRLIQVIFWNEVK